MRPLTAILDYYNAKVCFILVLINLPHIICHRPQSRFTKILYDNDNFEQQISLTRTFTVTLHFPLFFMKIINKKISKTASKRASRSVSVTNCKKIAVTVKLILGVAITAKLLIQCMFHQFSNYENGNPTEELL